MKYFVVFIALGLLFSCRQKSEKYVELATPINPVKDSTIYEFMNYILEHEIDSIFSLSCDLIADRELGVFDFSRDDSSRIASIFSEEDAEFIYKQLQVRKSFRLDPNYLPGKTIISTDTLNQFRNSDEGSTGFWKRYRQKYGKTGFCTIGMPLFSQNKQQVIVQTGFHCGRMCGYGGNYLFKKINGKWTIIRQFSSWIS